MSVCEDYAVVGVGCNHGCQPFPFFSRSHITLSPPFYFPFRDHCSNKAQTHFPRIRKLTGIPYDKMLFFDDCNWGDHVGMVGRGCTEENGEGVVGHRTPRGLSVPDWYKGLELYQKARS